MKTNRIIEWQEAGFTIIFFHKPNDKKLSFKVKGNAELTDKLLKDCKKKRVHLLKISFAAKGIVEKLQKITNDGQS